eukprot:TRINITY_DN3817_c0_g2_i1.p2 TRINITY_DN3817_c0_g2~~TRINITY_DN3817_c0_g2_i1.p2  ORF type:complete len:246 (+),score=28.28 TRINITY_DN3817_c0_g2_i1:156-893(+)
MPSSGQLSTQIDSPPFKQTPSLIDNSDSPFKTKHPAYDYEEFIRQLERGYKDGDHYQQKGSRQNSRQTNSRQKIRVPRPNSRTNIDLIESRKKLNPYELDDLLARTSNQEENVNKSPDPNNKDNLYDSVLKSNSVPKLNNSRLNAMKGQYFGKNFYQTNRNNGHQNNNNDNNNSSANQPESQSPQSNKGLKGLQALQARLAENAEKQKKRVQFDDNIDGKKTPFSYISQYQSPDKNKNPNNGEAA